MRTLYCPCLALIYPRAHLVVFVPCLTTYHFSSLGLSRDIPRFRPSSGCKPFAPTLPTTYACHHVKAERPCDSEPAGTGDSFHLSRSIVVASGGKVARQPMRIGVHW